MPRASRHFLPGQLWHITHHCHEKSFLLKFARDRRAHLRWRFQAKKRFGRLDRISRLEKVKRDPGTKARHREVDETDGTCVLREPRGAYTSPFGTENSVLRLENTALWTEIPANA